MDKISFVTPLMAVNKGPRSRNWKVVYKHLIPLIKKHGHEWVVAEKGSSKSVGLSGISRVPVFGNHNRSEMRNIGWQNASHEMICFLDSDCVLSHAAWKRAMVSCFGYDCYSPYKRGAKLGKVQTSNRVAKIIAGDWTKFSVPKTSNWNLCGGICFIKKELIEKVGGWDERFDGWGFEDIALEKIVRASGANWHLDRRHVCMHLYHYSSPGKKQQSYRTRHLYRRFYANKTFERIMELRNVNVKHKNS